MCARGLRRSIHAMFRPIPHISSALVVLSLAAAAPAHAAGPDHFTIRVSPRTVKAGVPVTLTAYAQDKVGSTLPGYSGPATFSDASGALGDATFVKGVASLEVKLPDPVHGEVVQVGSGDATSQSAP